MPPTLFAAELAQYGPNRNCGRSFTRQQSREYCRRLARAHYENFTVASWLLPRALRPYFFAIYAWCRWADDLADETAGPAESLALLDWWEEELLATCAGRPQHIVTVALQETIHTFDIPATPFLELLTAFRQDQQQTRYETTAELLEYCRYSANPVGHLVLYLGRCCDEPRARLSDQICTGLQLANFWQDIDRDFQRGRLYVPRESQVAYGVEEADFAARRATPALRRLLQEEVDRAAGMLRTGLALVPLVPRSLRVDVELFARGGLAILAAIRRVDYDVWTKRPTIAKVQQVRLLAGCWWRGLWSRSADSQIGDTVVRSETL